MGFWDLHILLERKYIYYHIHTSCSLDCEPFFFICARRSSQPRIPFNSRVTCVTVATSVSWHIKVDVFYLR